MTRPATRREGDARLLRLAKILEKVPVDEKAKDGRPLYCQRHFAHPCGAPACALGHWAANNPKRWKLLLRHDSLVPRLSKIQSAEESAEAEFAITSGEYQKLFSSFGCNNAQSGPEAAAYIRKFVANRTEKA